MYTSSPLPPLLNAHYLQFPEATEDVFVLTSFSRWIKMSLLEVCILCCS